MGKSEQDQLKKEVATKAAMIVGSDSVLGVGTGSTVVFFIDTLGERKEKENFSLKHIVTTSNRSKEQLGGLGFQADELADIDQADLIIDGADCVDNNLDGIKSGGGALILEKNVAVSSKEVIWIVDKSKLVHHLSGFPLSVGVLPVSAEQNFKRFEEEGLEPQWRLDNNGKRYVTHHGNYIIGLAANPTPIPRGLAGYLDHTVGVVEHGLFLDMCDRVVIARSDGTIKDKKRK